MWVPLTPIPRLIVASFLSASFLSILLSLLSLTSLAFIAQALLTYAAGPHGQRNRRGGGPKGVRGGAKKKASRRKRRGSRRKGSDENEEDDALEESTAKRREEIFVQANLTCHLREFLCYCLLLLLDFRALSSLSLSVSSLFRYESYRRILFNDNGTAYSELWASGEGEDESGRLPTPLALQYFTQTAIYLALLATPCILQAIARQERYMAVQEDRPQDEQDAESREEANAITKESIIHHLSSLSLFILSASIGESRIGSVVMFQHDISSVFLKMVWIVRLPNTFAQEKEKERKSKKGNRFTWSRVVLEPLTFLVFASFFFAFRLVSYPTHLCAIFYLHILPLGFFTGQTVCFTLLCVVLTLDVFWGKKIASILLKIVVGGGVEKEGSKKAPRKDKEHSNGDGRHAPEEEEDGEDRPKIEEEENDEEEEEEEDEEELRTHSLPSPMVNWQNLTTSTHYANGQHKALLRGHVLAVPGLLLAVAFIFPPLAPPHDISRREQEIASSVVEFLLKVTMVPYLAGAFYHSVREGRKREGNAMSAGGRGGGVMALIFVLSFFPFWDHYHHR